MSGLLDFFAGVAGPGAKDYFDREDKREALRAELMLKQLARKEEFDFRREQGRLDREARYGFVEGEGGGLLAGGGGNGGRRGGTPKDAADAEFSLERAKDSTIFALMQQGMSLPEAEQAWQARTTGENPYTKPVGVATDAGPERVDEPDVERLRQVAKQFSQALGAGWKQTNGAKYAENVADADATSFRTDQARGLLARGRAPEEAAIVSKGEALYSDNVNKATGILTPLGEAERELKGEQLTTELSKQRKSRAEATKAEGEVRGDLTNREQIQVIESFRKDIASQMLDLRQRKEMATKNADLADLKDIAKQFEDQEKDLRVRLDELDKMRRELLVQANTTSARSGQRTGQGAKPSAGGKKPTAAGAAARYMEGLGR